MNGRFRIALSACKSGLKMLQLRSFSFRDMRFYGFFKLIQSKFDSKNLTKFEFLHYIGLSFDETEELQYWPQSFTSQVGLIFELFVISTLPSAFQTFLPALG